MTLVGVVDGPSALDDPTPVAVVAPSLLDRGARCRHHDHVGGLRPGVDLSVLDVGTESQELYGARGIARLSVRPLLNAGEGTLLVPTDNRLVAFG